MRAYLLKEDFQSLWEYVSPYWAGRFLDRWCTRTMRSRLDPMKQVARMVRSHRELITQGQGAGSRIRILDWQRDFLARLLSAKTTEIGISMARGGGKSTRLAYVAAAYFIGPLRQPRGHVFIVASSIQQAVISLDHL